ncbi:GOLPH3/VPS74 family protein [Actinoallomurus sp. CA-142502]|uniref:GOLPH3/VPS74 family protein n=1 Tax=Actinoallomurus sp. CA-142502 TaxID=3239885 RepID=UPI003D938845
MNGSATLPRRLYLLAYDTRRQRITHRFELRYALRAAILIELLLRGHIADRDGTVLAERTGGGGDPVLRAALAEIEAAPGRSWKHWVRAGHRSVERAVSDQLSADGLITVRHRLGLRRARITVPDLQPVLQITNDVRRALREEHPDPADAALLALADAAGLPAAATTGRRARRQRIDRLAEPLGPVFPALRAVIRGMRAAASGGS